MVDNKKYAWLFASIVAVQATAWILIPYFVLPNPPIDVLEGFAWGQNIELGYHKGPPLFAWLLALGAKMMPGSLLPPLVFSQIAIAVTYWAVWRLACRLLGPRDALAIVALTSTIYYFGYPSPEFNEIILHMAPSAVAGSFFYTALVEERRRDWIIVGLAVGIGLLSRYSILLYLLPMAVFALLHRETRWRWVCPQFAIGALITCLLVLPHAWWVIHHDFNTLNYIDQRAGTVESFDRIVKPLRFAGAQLIGLAPALLVFALSVLPMRRISHADAEAAPLSPSSLTRAYLLAIGLAPALFVIVAAMILGRAPRAMWGGGLWIFTPLLAIVLLRAYAFPLYRRRLITVWSAVFMLPIVIFATTNVFGPTLSGRNKRTHFPGAELAQEVTAHWRNATGGQRLTYAIGEMSLAGSVGYYSSDRPQVFQNGSLRDAPWVDLDRVKRCGAVVLFQAPVDRAEFAQMMARLDIRYEEQAPLVLTPPRYAVPSPAFTVGWGIAWPAESEDPAAPPCKRPRRLPKLASLR